MKVIRNINIRKIKDVLRKYPDIIFAILYGSFVKSDPKPRDIDIALYIDKYTSMEKEITLKMKLQEELNKFLPLIADIKFLNDSPVEFQLEIVETGKVIYIKNRLLYTEYLERLSREALDTIQNRLSLKEAKEELYALN